MYSLHRSLKGRTQDPAVSVSDASEEATSMEDKGKEQEEIRRRKRRRREVEENEEEEKEPLSSSYCFAALLTIRHSVCTNCCFFTHKRC